MSRQDRTYRTVADLIHKTMGEPTVGCEVGVWQGELSEFLLKSFGGLRLLMVDRYELYEPGGRGRLSRIGSQSEMYEAMTDAADRTMFAKNRRMLMVGESVVASSIVADRSLDFAYIDADHRYDSTRADLESWYPKVRIGGLLCGHDYDGRGDREGRFGVKRAVDQFAEQHEYDVNLGPSWSRVWWFKKR